ncbi:MAG TPA: BatA domain-containing protein [Candidatus Ozemobacteraceae bacterium]|nr:BatA domain-containing protein [Candidatus Ozemobacteraceae bacterium]
MPLSFGNPWLLTGALAVGVPLWLHLYYRRTPVPRDFPSLRLIRLSVEAMTRRMKLRHLLLLALRILAVLLLTLAFARPFIGGGALSAGTGAPAAFVVILDNSLSMGTTHQGISLFNTARARAIEIVDQMGPYDKASVILCNDPGTVLFPQLTWDKNELKEAVRNAPLSAAGTNLAGALQPALKLLAPVRAFRRTVYLVTDLTKSSWEPLLATYDLKRIDPSIDLVLVQVGDAAPPNLAVTELAIDDPMVMKGRPATLRATVVNHSAQPHTTRLSILVGDDKKSEQTIELGPNGSKRLEIPLTFGDTGFQHVRAVLPADALPQDDVRHLAVQVRAPPRVLILRPPPDRDGKPNREDLFLRFALNPLNRTEGALFLVDSRSPEETGEVNPSEYATVFLVNQRSLPDALVKSLSKYLLGGGSLVTFCGPRVDPAWYNATLIDGLGGGYLLPARLFKRVGNAVSKAVAYQLTDLDTGHPAFKPFGTDGSGDPGRAPVYEFYQVQPNPSALVLARMSHGLPGIVEERRGQGRTLLVTFTADTGWTTWPLKPTFLPFVHASVMGMLSRQGINAGAIQPGTPVSLTVSEEGLKRVSLTLPTGQSQEIPLRRDNGEGLLHLTVAQTDQAGFYRLRFEGATEREEAFAVNPPPAESDLERLPQSRIVRFIRLEHQAGSKQSLGQKVVAVREGRDVSFPLLWALLLTVLAESILANRPLRLGGRASS